MNLNLTNLLDAGLVLDNDHILKVSLSSAGQGIDPLRSARFQADGERVRVPVGTVTDVMAIQVAMETLSCFYSHLSITTQLDIMKCIVK